MIERYALFDTAPIKERFGTANTILSNFKKRYNASPTQNLPVIVQRGDERKVEFKTWGLISKNAHDTNGVFRYKTYSVREDDVFKKPSTEHAVRSQRCIVPVNGFYLWRKSADRSQPHFIHLSNYEPFGLAGIYSTWTDPSGVERGTYAILTVESGGSLSDVSARSPVILDQTTEPSWLDPTLHDMTTVYNITLPYTADNLIIDAVSSAVDSKKTDTPALITRI